MLPPNPLIDQFLLEGCMRCPKGATPACKVHRWTDILEFLRQLLLETELQEERKWGMPTYTLNGKNVVILGVFKESCVLSFLKGGLLEDPYQILERPGPNSQEGRFIRFTQLSQAQEIEEKIKEYLHQAIAVERSGKKSGTKPALPVLPEELLQKFAEHPGLETAFFALIPGRQRGYVMHFSEAKQSTTRLNRIEKYVPKIFVGKGMLD
ncbi:MAG: YdeI/OmpD-associated family protein [Bacteroidetes bacterium]|nr:YdeI/OmpD-associated family protein [Bacteroidota bacterium]